jgi:hypothetical protein
MERQEEIIALGTDLEDAPEWVRRVQEQLRTSGVAKITFLGTRSRAELRRKVYHYFKGRRIEFRHSGRTPATSLGITVLISDPIRTSPPDNPGAQGEGNPRLATLAARAKQEEFNGKMCPVCKEYKPLAEFPLRVAAELWDSVPEGRRYYSYCRPCFNAYNRWRRRFLKEHNATVLVDQFASGHAPNPYFQQWLKEESANRS